jgi:hypothetical protein
MEYEVGFSVVCMAKEPAEILNKFIEHYTLAGAEKILLYYDGDATDLPLVSSDKLVLISCDEAFWASRQLRRPEPVVPRQKTVFNDAFSINRSDWLLICDADELVVGRIDLSLEQIPAKFDFVKLRPYEAVWTKGEDVNIPFGNTLFRKIAPRFLGKIVSLLVYGIDAKFFHSGIASHTQGKSIVRRTGNFSSMGVHAPRSDLLNKGTWLDVVISDTDVRLYHYSALSFNRWRTKLGGRIDGSRQDSSTRHVARFSPGQAALRDAFVNKLSTGREREIFDRVFVLSPRQVWILRMLGLLEYKI